MSECNKHDCDGVLEHIYEYLNAHDLPPGDCDEIKHHLKICRECFTKYEFEQKLLSRLRASASCSCPESLKKRIQTLIEKF